MSQENVELSKRVVDAWNRRDVEATVALADPEVVCHPVLEETTEGEAVPGPRGTAAVLQGPGPAGGGEPGRACLWRSPRLLVGAVHGSGASRAAAAPVTVSIAGA